MATTPARLRAREKEKEASQWAKTTFAFAFFFNSIANRASPRPRPPTAAWRPDAARHACCGASSARGTRSGRRHTPGCAVCVVPAWLCCRAAHSRFAGTLAAAVVCRWWWWWWREWEAESGETPAPARPALTTTPAARPRRASAFFAFPAPRRASHLHARHPGGPTRPATVGTRGGPRPTRGRGGPATVHAPKRKRHPDTHRPPPPPAARLARRRRRVPDAAPADPPGCAVGVGLVQR